MADALTGTWSESRCPTQGPQLWSAVWPWNPCASPEPPGAPRLWHLLLTSSHPPAPATLLSPWLPPLPNPSSQRVPKLSPGLPSTQPLTWGPTSGLQDSNRG